MIKTLAYCFADITESPIERILLSVLAMHIGGPVIRKKDFHGASFIKDVVPQYQDCGYRIDIAVLTDSAKIAVECDGHEFHERTKEQAARDHARTRKLTANGWHVIRFTGSQIYKDPMLCGMEIMNIVNSLNVDNVKAS